MAFPCFLDFKQHLANSLFSGLSFVFKFAWAGPDSAGIKREELLTTCIARLHICTASE